MFTESAMIKQRSNAFGYTVATSHEAGHLPSWIYTGSGVKINSNTSAGSIQTGQTTLDKILGTITSIFALQKGAGYVPTTTQPQQQVYQQQQLTPEQLALLYSQQQGSVAAQAAFDLETFIKNNTGLLLVGGLGVVLFMSGRK